MEYNVNVSSNLPNLLLVMHWVHKPRSLIEWTINHFLMGHFQLHMEDAYLEYATMDLHLLIMALKVLLQVETSSTVYSVTINFAKYAGEIPIL